MNAQELEIRIKTLAYRIVKWCGSLPAGKLPRIIEDLNLFSVEKLSAIKKEATEIASILAAARKTSQSSLK